MTCAQTKHTLFREESEYHQRDRNSTTVGNTHSSMKRTTAETGLCSNAIVRYAGR